MFLPLLHRTVLEETGKYWKREMGKDRRITSGGIKPGFTIWYLSQMSYDSRPPPPHISIEAQKAPKNILEIIEKPLTASVTCSTVLCCRYGLEYSLQGLKLTLPCGPCILLHCVMRPPKTHTHILAFVVCELEYPNIWVHNECSAQLHTFSE